MVEQVTDPIRAKYMGITGLYPMSIYNASSRLGMASSQGGQRMVNLFPERAVIVSGLDKDFNKHTFSKKATEAWKVIDVIRASPSSNTRLLTIIYEVIETGEHGELTIPGHFSLHTKFGFEYQVTSELKALRTGSVIPAGTILADSKAVDGAFYNTGVHLQTAVCSKEGTAEDGVDANEETINRLSYNVFPDIVIPIGEDEIPTNRYGDDNMFKCIPEPGDRVNVDGVIMGLRTIDEGIIAAQATNELLQTDAYEDKLYQLPHMAGAEVESVKVIINNTAKSYYVGKHFDQLERLAAEYDTYHKAILDVYYKAKGRAKYSVRPLQVTPSLTNLIVRAKTLLDCSRRGTRKTRLVMKKDPLKIFTVYITLRKVASPHKGGKITDRSSAKSVITGMKPVVQMPMDQEGTRADIVVSKEATPNRMILGRDAEHYISGAVFKAGKLLREILQIPEQCGPRRTKDIVRKHIRGQTQEGYDAISLLVEFHGYLNHHLSKLLYEARENNSIDELVDEVLDSVIHNPISPLPADLLGGKPAWTMAVALSTTKFAPHIGPVTFEDHNGKTIVTKQSILIAPCYYSCLEKDGTEYSVASSGKLQPQGLTSLSCAKDKVLSPISHTNSSLAGIDETFVLSGTLGHKGLIELFDRVASPDTHIAETIAILDSDKPMGQYNLINREETPYGRIRFRRILEHMLACIGTELVYEPEPVYATANLKPIPIPNKSK